MGSLTPELSSLIDAHRAAFETFEATHEDDDNFLSASRAEDIARYEVAVRPCADAAEFIEKLRYLMEIERSLWGEPEFLTQFGSIAVAVRDYFEQEQASRQ